MSADNELPDEVIIGVYSNGDLAVLQRDELTWLESHAGSRAYVVRMVPVEELTLVPPVPACIRRTSVDTAELYEGIARELRSRGIHPATPEYSGAMAAARAILNRRQT